jgi:protein-tyrosine phosphatase
LDLDRPPDVNPLLRRPGPPGRWRLPVVGPRIQSERVGFVDLHSHVLPGLDDGSRQLEESLEMLKLLRQMGFDAVCATPHQKQHSFVPSREEIDGAHARVSAALPPGSVELLLAAENMWDELFLERSEAGTIPGYTGGRAFLFELPVHLMPPRVEERLFAIRTVLGGRQRPLSVMAHPERYPALWEDRGRVEALHARTALVVDLAALDGAHGTKQCKAARWMVEEGYAHAAASDCHQPSDVRQAGAGLQWIRKRLGEVAVSRLLSDGPRQILNGELPE